MDKRTLDEVKRIVGSPNFLPTHEAALCYSYDATPNTRVSEVTVTPTDTAMVARLVHLANERGFAIVPRGAGTGLSGGSLPANGGVVLAMTRMNRILEINPEDMVAVVQPGVITARLQAEVERHGLFYPPDPASQSVSTIGGNVAECAGGPRGVKYGVTRDYVLGLEVVTAQGDIARLGSRTIKNTTGYNLVQLFVGSEGTLGVITEITLRLVPKPAAKRTLLATYPHLDDASRTVTRILLSGVTPATIELMDNTTIRTVEDYLHIGLPTDAEAVLLIDVDGDEASVVAQAATVNRVCRENGATEVQEAATAEESDRLWLGRRSANPAQVRLRPNRLSEDIVVPRGQIPEMVRRIQAIGRRLNIIVSIYGHAGDGNLHPAMLYDAHDPEEVERVRQAERDIYVATTELGGTLTGEHGIGLSKKQFMPLDLPAPTLDLMRQLKRTLDPKGIMNPGKMFPDA